MSNHWFWFTIAMLAIGWYSTITIYVAIRGAFDIRSMLDRLKETNGESSPSSEA